MKKAISVANILKYNPRLMPFEGKWFDSFGCPEMRGCWIVWGASGSGKTRFALQLAKYLTIFGRVVYNSLEEGLSLSFKRAFIETGMASAKHFSLLDKEPIADLTKRIELKKSPDIYIVDSVQYSGLSKEAAKKLVDEHKSKLFIFISHAEGYNPKGCVAQAIRYYSDVKLFVEGYKISSPVSRFKEGVCQPFVIWEEGAKFNL